MEESSTGRLSELAEQKLHMLLQLRELSLDQTQLAGTHRVDDLLSLLSRKSEVIDSLRSIQEALIPFQSQDPETRQWTCESDRAKCREVLAQSERLIAELLVIDNQTLGEMTQQREIIGQQLNQFASAEAILEAYGGSYGLSEDSNEPSLSLDG